jgi:AcrR family transcriptional regulator
LTPRKQPRQQRAQETLAAILQAAVEVIDEVGYAKATTNRIAARAGVSIGSLYQYFPNKDAILISLLDRHHAEVHAVVDRSLERIEDVAIPLSEGLRGLFLGLARLHDADPRLNRVLGTDVPHPPTIEERDQQDARGYLTRTETALRARPEVSVDDYVIAALIVVQSTSALSRWLLHEAPRSVDRRLFIGEAVGMLVGYLEGRERAGSRA